MQQKKYRDKHGLFVAEGPKLIDELLQSGIKLHSFFSTEAIAESPENHYEISARDLRKISGLKSPNTALALFKIPEPQELKINGLSLALDAVRDPGNLGTIIRLCDWFGISRLLCSPDTADCFNPKVVQATMGSIARVNIHYIDLEDFLSQTELPVYGAVMNGSNVYSAPFEQDAILVMGNEANGISEGVLKAVTHSVTIPRFGGNDTESLNVATATAILLSEFRRATEM